MVLQFNEASYKANVCSDHGSTLYTILLTGDADVDKVKADVESCATIVETADNNSTETHIGFNTVDSIRPLTTLSAEGESVKAMEVVFTKTPIDAQVAKNTADIEYVATIAGVEM